MRRFSSSNRSARDICAPDVAGEEPRMLLLLMEPGFGELGRCWPTEDVDMVVGVARRVVEPMADGLECDMDGCEPLLMLRPPYPAPFEGARDMAEVTAVAVCNG